jgi:hypothetical protein
VSSIASSTLIIGSRVRDASTPSEAIVLSKEGSGMNLRL